MEKLKKQELEWDLIYKKPLEEIPWTYLDFGKPLIKMLNLLEKEKKLIVTGCGSGDNLEILHQLGFKNMIGYDISKNAIKIAKKNYPKFKFKVSETVKIKDKGNVLDKAVIHHIPNSRLKKYIHKLDKIGDKIICCYFNGNYRKKSLIKKKSPLYYHDPKKVEKMFKKHVLKKQEKYIVKTHPINKKITKFGMLCQYYELR